MHQSSYRIYYEDTDAGGVVYYANYLKFAERARTDWLRAKGIEQQKLALTEGIWVVVRHATLSIQSPARLDDLLQITSKLQGQSGARVTLAQQMHVDPQLCASLTVELACVRRNGDAQMVPTRWPRHILEALGP